MIESFHQIPPLSAIYYALLQHGYDYYSLERDTAHSSLIEGFVHTQRVPSYFSQVRQTGCAVYPYWPRAAILETAVFSLNAACDGFADFGSLVRRIEAMPNISPQEKGDDLQAWLSVFPKALRQVMDGDGFQRYLTWEKQWIERQNSIHQEDLSLLDKALRICAERYQAPHPRVIIVLNPVKCVYSSDHYLLNDAFIFTSGAMRPESILHEYFHPIVHSLLETGAFSIVRAVYPDIDESYYLDGSGLGFQNAFEEYAVRQLTEKSMQRDYPQDLAAYLKELAASRQ